MESKIKSIIPVERIEKKIYLIRNQKVMIDRDLAELYGVTTGNLNKAVSRNSDNFPEDFMFRLTKKEFNNLKFHFGTSSWGGTRKLSRVFTEQGVAMLSGVLKSKKAIQVNIQIMRAFINLNKMILIDSKLRMFFEKVEKQGIEIKSNKEQIHKLATLITRMLTVRNKEKIRKIGF